MKNRIARNKSLLFTLFITIIYFFLLAIFLGPWPWNGSFNITKENISFVILLFSAVLIILDAGMYYISYNALVLEEEEKNLEESK